jgi:hypothetical protein
MGENLNFQELVQTVPGWSSLFYPEEPGSGPGNTHAQTRQSAVSSGFGAILALANCR